MRLINARIALTPRQADYGMIDSGAIITEGERILWSGSMAELPEGGGEEVDLEGRLVTPGLIDCHTHLVHGGNRAREFEQRLNGKSYSEIAREGGGILSTVRETRAASEETLLALALPRIDVLIHEGVTTVEIKSGYGLDLETELKMLRVARRIAQERPISARTSFLGAHAVPEDFSGRADDYLSEVVFPTMELGAGLGLIDAVDGFCEAIAFDAPQIERLFVKAGSLGLPVKLHAEQLSHMGGTALAARYQALSADHLEYANAEDAEAMAAAGTVAVLLPGAFYTLRETQSPPVQAFRETGVAMAVATDCNPGSSPLFSPLMAMNMACTLFRLTPQEALAGTTCHAAQALGLEDRGSLQAGARADLAIWDVEHPAELAYRIGANPLYARMFGGVM